jgi:hypothetical protein
MPKVCRPPPASGTLALGVGILAAWIQPDLSVQAQVQGLARPSQ